APDGDIHKLLVDYFKLGCSDILITELLKFHYDTTVCGLRLHKKWNLLSTHQQKHSVEMIYDQVCKICKHFPLCGAEGIRKEVISCLLNTVEPEEVKAHCRRGFKQRHFWAAGINDVWPQDQHDKWGQFGLWLHAGLEAFSGEINWLKIWWTNKNLRLIAKYYIDTCQQIG
ncbi:hypothetical protein L208DRAFT_1062343, partial [Tricholoma matsutake]